ncbi:Uncharacterised protein [Mycobacteroides abscessus subsp. abscessus]|nr:Uncharacterised protein [Mycobacteroides abscessus subsp. abscessus]
MPSAGMSLGSRGDTRSVIPGIYRVTPPSVPFLGVRSIGQTFGNIRHHAEPGPHGVCSGHHVQLMATFG